ncbi:DNA methyltransferase [Nocardioides sp.]|uniref:DNA methyltransferase n=1 Tax=Nocardioides sp. TaxID=35761 RepID=UPI003783F4F3
MADNKLFYGDNLDVLRQHIKSESVDLVYLDPPFNSNRNYNVIFGRNQAHSADDAAQIQAFGDTWVWTPTTDEQYVGLIQGGLPTRAADALTAFRTLLGENDAMAYLVNMAPRLLQMHRTLKESGSLWLHCDPTMSHYLKVLLDSIFGAANFRNEVVWQRTGSKGLMARRLANNHDVLLSYQKSDAAKWNLDETFVPYDLNDLDPKTAAKYSNLDDDGRRFELKDITNPNPDRPNLTYEFMGVTRVWRWTKERMQAAYDAGLIVQTAPGRVPRAKKYLDEQRGKPLGDVWADIAPLNSQAAERLGYPTQKPLALMERIIKATTDAGDVVLDPFCGCGTTVDAAQNLGRQWVGIDVTYIAVDLIRKRLRHTYGDDIESTYEVLGIPRDRAGAFALFSHSPFDFERWAVSLVNAQPNEKQVGDRGIDGKARFLLDGSGKNLGTILVSVKGGKSIGPQFVRDLLGTVETQKAEMGILITMAEPTRGIIDAVNHAGTYTHPANEQKFPKVQVITVDRLLKGEKPNVPLTILPYIEAKRARTKNTDEGLF